MESTQVVQKNFDCIGTENLTGWLLRWIRGLKMTRTEPSREMQLLETLALGAKRQLLLVECGGQRFLVAGNNEGIGSIVPVHGSRFVQGLQGEPGGQ